MGMVGNRAFNRQPQANLIVLGNSFEAYGMVLDFLSRCEPFPHYDLGHVSAAVRLQLRHEHHVAALEGRALTGYVGWLPTTSEAASLWMQDEGPLTPVVDREVDAIAVTIVATAGPSMTRPVIRAMRTRNAGKRLFFKRVTAQDPNSARKATVMNMRTSMKLFASLLATVSISALLAAGPTAAQDGSIVVEATGGFIMGDNPSARQFFDANGSAFSETSISGITGGYGAVRIGKHVTPLWDITGRFALTSLGPGTASYISSGLIFDVVGTVDTDLDFQTLDLEVGYTPALDDAFDLRFFGGARGLHYTNSFEHAADKIGGVGPTPPDLDRRREFYGVGPRVGLEFEARPGGSPVGFSGLVGGAVILGMERVTDTVSGPVPPSTVSNDVAKAIVDLEAAVALDLHVSEQTKISLGYRGEQLSGVNDFFSGMDAAGQLVHGPFVKLKATF